jgi:septal ring factor EnvC (AmiA/AmiB activator)
LTLDTILTELKAERDRLNQAIAALEGTTATVRGRKKAHNIEKPRRRRMSAAARKRLSEAKRKWWAERKKKTKGV